MCVFALILCSVALCACQQEQRAPAQPTPTSAPSEKNIPEVETTEVTLWESDIQQRFSGAIRPLKRALLSTRMSGTLTHLYVAAGDEVEAGALLAQVDARDIVAALEAAQAHQNAAQSAYTKAQLDVQRLERLYADDLIARNNLERAVVERDRTKAAVEQARTQVRVQQTNLEYARISAPFCGVVSEVPIDQGSFVGPGTTLVVLEDRSSFRIDVPIPAGVANSLQRHTSTFMVNAPFLNQPLKATYQDTVPSMERGGVGQILRLELETTDGKIRPGQVVEVDIKNLEPLETSEDTEFKNPATAIPRSALIHQGQLTSVMLVVKGSIPTDTIVQKRWVVTASSDTRAQARDSSESMVKVIQGLQPGALVVLNPTSTLADGQVVNLKVEPN
ncbi:MAG: efflux RND transporter periplasmic adaptor subunit [Desulfuromonadaceae bacterium]|nr:efflux RND transporter periplasmic adaptor subunit [Desulfuromonadaceae bacterium]